VGELKAMLFSAKKEIEKLREQNAALLANNTAR
jgi:hypothetical protein